MSDSSNFFSDDGLELESIEDDGVTYDSKSEGVQSESQEKGKDNAENQQGDVLDDDHEASLSDNDELFQKNKKKRKHVAIASRKNARKPSGRVKRSHMSGRNFMDTEAVVDDQDDDDEEDEENEEDAAFLKEVQETQQVEKQLGFARHRRLAMQLSDTNERRAFPSHLESAIGSLERRYQNQTLTEEDTAIDDIVDDESDDEEEEEDHYSYRDHPSDTYRMPMDMKDVQLWKIRIVKGASSQQVVIGIMNKFVYMMQRDHAFPIFSAFAPHGIRGHIYVEGTNFMQIKTVLHGFRSLILSSIKIVPLNEMISVFGMGETKKVLPPNELVRVRGGIYNGDLAQVMNIAELGGSVWIRVVPRLNLSDLSDSKFPPSNKTQPESAQLITREEIELKGGFVESGPRWGTFRFGGKIFTESGYLLCKVRRQALITGSDVAATDEEIKEFAKGLKNRSNDELGGWEEFSAVLPAARSVIYNIGDKVVVHSGDVAGVRGVVVSLEGKAVNVQLEDKSLQDIISVETSAIVKLFQVGDSVKAISGPNKGTSGLITSVDLKAGNATVFYPALSRPLQCSLDYLQACPDICVATATMLGGYSVGDLVQLTEHETGVILRIDTGGAFLVLTPNNKVESVPLSRVVAKRSNEFAVALDRNNMKFGVKASVTLIANGQKYIGRVSHIWRNYVFVKLNNKDEGHYGFVVCDSKDVSVRLPDGATSTTSSWSKMPQTDKGASFSGNERYQRHGYRGGRGGRGWVGNRVRVISGRNKGSFGVVLGYEPAGRLRIRLSQNGFTACLNRDELIVLSESTNQYSGGRGRTYDKRGDNRDETSLDNRSNARNNNGNDRPNNKSEAWNSYFEGFRGSNVTQKVGQNG